MWIGQFGIPSTVIRPSLDANIHSFDAKSTFNSPEVSGRVYIFQRHDLLHIEVFGTESGRSKNKRPISYRKSGKTRKKNGFGV